MVVRTAAAATGGDGLDRVRASGVLRWGGDLQGGEPYVFQDPADPTRIAGFEVDIADALARRLGVRATFVQNDWQLLVPALERGDLDVILNGLEVTAARRRRVAFTRPYFGFAATLVVRRDADATPGWPACAAAASARSAGRCRTTCWRPSPDSTSCSTRAPRSPTSTSSTVGSTAWCSTTSSPSATAWCARRCAPAGSWERASTPSASDPTSRRCTAPSTTHWAT